MYEVNIGARSVAPFAELLGEARIAALRERASALHDRLGARAIWNINSTRAGGGVAEMLQSTLRYARGLGVAARWLVIEAPPEFFRITKRLHNALHGSHGDGSPLGPEQARALRAGDARQRSSRSTRWCVPDDVVICHDPQTAGLVPHLRRARARTWCGAATSATSATTREVDRGWAFLRPYLEPARFAVFSRSAYAPAWIAARRTVVLAPNIDPFSAKNQALVRRRRSAPSSRTSGWSTGRRPAGRARSSRATTAAWAASIARPRWSAWASRRASDTPLVVQVSRWDAMKDPDRRAPGLRAAIEPGRRGAAPSSCWPARASTPSRTIPKAPRSSRSSSARGARCRTRCAARVHLALLPMQDAEENAAIVNALQRHAAVIVQKSLHEGFGLTVTEALWKRRPVVASAVGGIVDQIRDGVDGLLVHDPTDLDEFATRAAALLGDRALAQRLRRRRLRSRTRQLLDDLGARALGRAGRAAARLKGYQRGACDRLSVAARSRWYRRSRGPLGACRSMRRSSGSISGVASPWRSASAMLCSCPLRVAVCASSARSARASSRSSAVRSVPKGNSGNRPRARSGASAAS